VTDTPSIRHILNADIAKWVQRRIKTGLTGRALGCAVNAQNFLIRAEKIARISPEVSYFCATHATEEAVASFVSACKVAGYAEAKQINLRDHKHKATVSAFAQFVSGHAQDIALSVAHEPGADTLVVRVGEGDAAAYYPLGLHLFTFNEDRHSDTHANALAGFSALFPDAQAMFAHITKRSEFRNQALYASERGAPAMTTKVLGLQLHDHALLTLGLLWAAIEVGQGDHREPFVLQVLGAINEVTTGFARRAPGV
jgi:hypothetical protein